jgi:hypothetical protein
MTGPLNRDPLAEHGRLVDVIAAAGVAPPDEWVRLRVRLKSFNQLGTPMLSRLVDAVLDGSPDGDVEALRASAYAEQQAAVKVHNAVSTAVLRRMRDTYSTVAVENYGKVAEIFDAAAAHFTSTARVVDVEASGESMVDQPDKQRRAWLDAAKYAHQLTKLLPSLHAAAQLAGVPETAGREVGGGSGASRRDAVLIPLCVNVTDQHRRRVWEAWESAGRCGRWSTLHAADVAIRALPADQLTTFAPYRPAKPLQEQLVPISPIGTYQNVIVDPEDPQLPPELAKRTTFKQLAR